MKILYIHGLDSRPNPERILFLEKRGHEVCALHLDYMNEPNTYQILKDFAIVNKVDFIVGSSLGGYLGYWIGQDLRVAQLLFNPAVAMRSITLDAPNPIIESVDIKTWVVLGKHDERVPYQGNIDFFKSRPQAKIITCEWLAHEIDIESFEDTARWCALI